MRDLFARSTMRTAAIIGLAWTLLFGAVGIGLRVPFMESLLGPRGRGGLDYSARPPALTPLSEAYIDRLLGPGTEPRNDPGDDAVPSRVIRHVAGKIGRTFVNHSRTNDEVDGAYTIASIPFTAGSDTRGATRSGDPDGCSAVGGTVWYRYRSPRELGLVAYTMGTDHGVVLGVFERRGEELHRVGVCDRDDSGNALITLNAVRGRTYLFQITAPVGGGRLRFSLDPRGSIDRAIGSRSGPAVNAVVRANHITPDGRYIAMWSNATNLGREPPPSCEEVASRRHIRYQQPTAVCGQVYVLERETGRVERISESADGRPGNGNSKNNPFLSGDGRFVAFVSEADNLGPSDGPGWDVFVKDRRTGAVELITPPLSPNQAHHVQEDMVGFGFFLPTLSYDGRFVAFQSPTALVSHDTNEGWDVYVFDRTSKSFELASVDSSERISERSPQRDVRTTNGNAWLENNRWVDLTPFISRDGRFVVFRSDASNLVEGDRNHVFDTFVRDRTLGITERVSVSDDEQEGDLPTGWRVGPVTQTISNDGRFVVFDSAATNLIPGERADVSNDIYVRDRLAGTTKRIGASLGDFLEAQDPRYPSGFHIETPHWPSISGNGRFITFTKIAYNDDYAECEEFDDALFGCNQDVFMHDMLTNTTMPISQSEGGKDLWGSASSVSDDGRIVMYHSQRDGEPLQPYLYEAERPL